MKEWVKSNFTLITVDILRYQWKYSISTIDRSATSSLMSFDALRYVYEFEVLYCFAGQYSSSVLVDVLRHCYPWIISWLVAWCLWRCFTCLRPDTLYSLTYCFGIWKGTPWIPPLYDLRPTLSMDTPMGVVCMDILCTLDLALWHVPSSTVKNNMNMLDFWYTFWRHTG